MKKKLLLMGVLFVQLLRTKGTNQIGYREGD